MAKSASEYSKLIHFFPRDLPNKKTHVNELKEIHKNVQVSLNCDWKIKGNKTVHKQ